MLTIDLDDEILDPSADEKAKVDGEAEHDAHTPAPLIPGSVTAQALYKVWSGVPVVIVDSPPGAGKSTLVAALTAHLSTRSDVAVTVATPTKRQALDIALRIAEQVPTGMVNLAVSKIADQFDVPEHIRTSNATGGMKGMSGTVTVRTVDSCKLSPPDTDLLVIDEAYQVTYAKALLAAENAKQVLMVGDPGQIGPVVPVDTSTWDRQQTGPHMRAPEAFAQRTDAEVINLGSTYRLGQPTVDAIAPLYDFAFDSARPDRYVVGRDELESVRVAASGDPYDMVTLRKVAELAAGLVGSELVETDADGTETSRPLTGEDVAVVASHNAQVSGIAGIIDGLGIEGVTVGTADKLQGGQWHAVIALDPFTGYEGLSPHALSLGRLCVMASRHRAHLTWVSDGKWADRLTDSGLSKDVARRHREVREALCS